MTTQRITIFKAKKNNKYFISLNKWMYVTSLTLIKTDKPGEWQIDIELYERKEYEDNKHS